MTTRRALTGAALLAVGWLVTSLPPFSVAATVVVIGAGVLAISLGLRHRVKRPGGRPRWDATPWALLAGALAGWQLAAYLQTPRSEHPTLSSITNAALDPHPARALAFVAWMLVAAGLASRWPER